MMGWWYLLVAIKAGVVLWAVLGFMLWQRAHS